MQGWKLDRWGVGLHGNFPVQLNTVLLYSKLIHKAVTEPPCLRGRHRMSSNPTRPVRQERLLAPLAAEAGARSMESVYAATHVVKCLSASQPGALKLARRFGDALVCVRHRHDPVGRYRYTTVELVVDEAPVGRQTKFDAMVMVHLAFNETELRQLVLAHGALWNAGRRLWSMPRGTAKALRLLARIVKA